MSTFARVLLNNFCLFNHKILTKMGRNKFQGGQKRKFDKPREQKGHKFQEKDKGNDDFTHGKYGNVKESSVGIESYTTSLTNRFSGLVKERFSDFHVNEIDLEGVEVKLSDLTVPEEPQTEETDLKDCLLITEGLVILEQLTQIQEMVAGDDFDKKVLIDVTALEKEKRGLIHQTLKKVFGHDIAAGTKTDAEQKFIEVRKFNAKKRDRKDWAFPEEYVSFVLYKENVDTVQAINALTAKSGLRPNHFTYAGTKDKRAKTSQRVSVRRVDPKKIANAAKYCHNIHVGNFEFRKETLKLGQLKGNRFRIALRDVTADDDVISNTLEEFKENGFINYFGLQRFGNFATVPTYEIGLALLRQQWKNACELIMKPRDGDPADIKEMRDHWWKTRDAKAARKMLRFSCTMVEARLLEGFCKTGETDFLNALNNIPRNMRLLYAHSYQSLIWNKVVTRRVKEMGLQLCVGDLVFAETSKNVELLEEPLDEAETSEPETDTPTPETPVDESYYKKLVRPLTADDISSGKFTIFDIVAPLPGHDITYPSNQMSEWYTELLAEDNLSSEALKQEKRKIYSLAGSYRKLFVKPQSCTWKVQKYENPNDNLVLSDLEVLRGETLGPTPETATLKAVILDLVLPSSCYATMALREIVKPEVAQETTDIDEPESKRLKAAVE